MWRYCSRAGKKKKKHENTKCGCVIQWNPNRHLMHFRVPKAHSTTTCICLEWKQEKPYGHSGQSKYREWNQKKEEKRAPTASLKLKKFFANE